MDPALQAFLAFVGGMFISAAGFGWWSAAKYFGLKIEMREEIRATRHQLTGSIGQERVWREENDAKLEVRIRGLEEYRARRNGDHGGNR